MRKQAVAVAVAASILGAATMAFAQQPQVNVYTVHGDVSPNKVGTKHKPVAVGLVFDYTMREKSGLRPNPVRTYTIAFYGGHENTTLFPGCPAAKINAARSDAGCPKGSLVGKGSLTAVAGATSDPTDTSIRCVLPAKIYNGGKGHASLYLKVAPPDCPVSINQAIDMRYVNAFGGKGRGLRFSVPDNLLHPIPGLEDAVVDVKTTLPRKTVKVHGRTRGYFESTEPCLKGKRMVSVTFTTVAGQRTTLSDSKAC